MEKKKVFFLLFAVTYFFFVASLTFPSNIRAVKINKNKIGKGEEVDDLEYNGGLFEALFE